MLLFQSVLLASLASVASSTPVINPTHHTDHRAPIRAAASLAKAAWQKLELASPCSPTVNGSALPCLSSRSAHGATEAVPVAGSYAQPALSMPRRNDSFRTIGGFIHLDLLADTHLRTGPEFSWSSPDSPREDLQKMRLVSPGWGLRYFLADVPLAVGVSACSRIVMMGKQLPLVDPLTSEARVEFRLP